MSTQQPSTATSSAQPAPSTPAPAPSPLRHGVVEDILFALNRENGITLIVVTHDEELAARCDRRLMIRDGLLVEDSAAVAA